MKGQAFSTFKILIGSVFAITLLAIVYFITSSYSSPISSADTLKDILVQATNAPGICFSRNMLEFNAGEVIRASSFSPIEIEGFYSMVPSAVSCVKWECSFNEKIKLSVSARCDPNCRVYFGSETC